MTLVKRPAGALSLVLCMVELDQVLLMWHCLNSGKFLSEGGGLKSHINAGPTGGHPKWVRGIKGRIKCYTDTGWAVWLVIFCILGMEGSSVSRDSTIEMVKEQRVGIGGWLSHTRIWALHGKNVLLVKCIQKAAVCVCVWVYVYSPNFKCWLCTYILKSLWYKQKISSG